jgi:hypothetical protein
MYELHQHEQYFWNEETVNILASFVSTYENPCCLCAPLLGQKLVEQTKAVTILDCDERFSHLPGFVQYDLYRPTPRPQKFDIIICDPPFFNVSLSQLFKAIRLLSQFEYSQPLLLCYLSRRATNLMGTFASFDLKPTGYQPGYQTVQRNGRNEIEFFSNLSPEAIQRLNVK